MNLTADAGTVIGLLGVGFAFASFVMKGMLPLRTLAIAGNLCFVAYGYMESLLPSLVLNLALLPVNVLRVVEIRRMTAAIARATEQSPVSQWLLPHMQRRAFKAGDVLFRKGDAAKEVYYVSSGQVRIEEDDRLLGAGELIGEIGLFAPDRRRTKTIVCHTDGDLYRMSDEMIYQLYYQNPALGFYFMRLVMQRLFRDLSREAGTQGG
jgi:hypothetical protein